MNYVDPRAKFTFYGSKESGGDTQYLPRNAQAAQLISHSRPMIRKAIMSGKNTNTITKLPLRRAPKFD